MEMKIKMINKELKEKCRKSATKYVKKKYSSTNKATIQNWTVEY